MALDIPQQRLHTQRLTANPFEHPAEVVDWLLAVQSQDYFGAKWALGLRLRNTHDADLDRAFNAGEILRTHVLRPTWHFVTPIDLRWLLALTAPRVHAANAGMYRRLELDSVTLKHSHRTLVKALQNKQYLTREELGERLAAAGITAVGQRLAYIIMHAELEGVICSGPRRGKQFTYALLEERAPAGAVLKRDEALAVLTRRFFASHGPATVRDCAKWSGLAAADVKRGLAAVQDQLQHETLNEIEYWFETIHASRQYTRPPAYLLSVYDEYLIGYHDRSLIATPEIAAKLFTLGNALTAIIVVAGHIVGSWRRTIGKETVTIELQPFRELTKAERRAIEIAAQRYGDFLERTVELI